MLLKCVTVNMRGLCGNAKRAAFYEFIRQKAYDIVLVQETHMANEEVIKRAKRDWEGLSFWGKGEVNSKGVAVLFRKNLDIAIRKTEEGDNGRFLRIDGLLFGHKICIINVYLPNDAMQRKDFIDSLLMRIQTTDPMIIGGDFNFIMDNDLDWQAIGKEHADRRTKSYHMTSVKFFQHIIDVYRLYDVFRVFAPDKREFTFTSIQSRNSTRLDRFYVSRIDKSCIRDVEHSTVIWTDHKAVVMKLEFKGRDLGKGILEM
jgi:exonuclease III